MLEFYDVGNETRRVIRVPVGERVLVNQLDVDARGLLGQAVDLLVRRIATVATDPAIRHPPLCHKLVKFLPELQVLQRTVMPWSTSTPVIRFPPWQVAHAGKHVLRIADDHDCGTNRNLPQAVDHSEHLGADEPYLKNRLTIAISGD